MFIFVAFTLLVLRILGIKFLYMVAMSVKNQYLFWILLLLVTYSHIEHYHINEPSVSHALVTLRV